MAEHEEYADGPVSRAARECGLAVGEYLAWEKLVAGELLTREDKNWIEHTITERCQTQITRS